MSGYVVQRWDSMNGWVCLGFPHGSATSENELLRALGPILSDRPMEYRIVNLDDPHASPLLVTIERER